jgi:hypothetical protein
MDRLSPLANRGYYLIFDCPGQAELFTHHESFANIVAKLQKEADYRLVAVHLVDSHHCTDPGKFIAAALLSLQAMVRLELPHLNVLSKADLVDNLNKEGALQRMRGMGDVVHCSHCLYIDPLFTPIRAGLGVDAFTEMMNLHRFLPHKDDDDEDEDEGDEGYRYSSHHHDHEDDEDCGHDHNESTAGSTDAAESSSSAAAVSGTQSQLVGSGPRTSRFLQRHRKLHERIVELVTDFNLVAFTTISVKDTASLVELSKAIDKANAFVLTRTAAATAAETAAQRAERES